MARGGVLLKLVELPIFNAVIVNPDSGCVEWPGGVDLCPDATHHAMTGSESEAELGSGFAGRRGEEVISNPTGLIFSTQSRQDAKAQGKLESFIASPALGVRIRYRLSMGAQTLSFSLLSESLVKNRRDTNG